jgi:phosphomannomutase
MNLKAKYLFFDLDDTLTPNKAPMEDNMYKLLYSLQHTKVIVSGANIDHIAAQTRGLPFHKLGQNGNHAVTTTGDVLWQEQLIPVEIDAIKEHVDAIKRFVSHAIDASQNTLVNHGGQVSFSLLKQGTDRNMKESFDPDKTFRQEILKSTPSVHDSIDVTVAGSTSFDYLRKGKHKGYYVQKFIDHMGWDKKECIYFGDSFYPGGNDEPVQGVIETVPVSNHYETYELLTRFMKPVLD